jgi:hypothetical protein
MTVSHPSHLHRRLRLALVVSVLLVIRPTALRAQSARSDRGIAADSAAWTCIDKAMQPYLARATQTFPAVRSRFLTGQLAGSELYVTTRLRDSQGRTEQVFVRVDSIGRDSVFGRVASDVTLVVGLENGSSYHLKTSEMLDWTVVAGNGEEEGNFVGKFLDSLRTRIQRSGMPKPC